MRTILRIALVLALTAPGVSYAKASVRAVCSGGCKIKIDGSRAEKVSDSEWIFKEVDPGIREVDVSRGFEGGWLDVPAEGEVTLWVSKEPLRAQGALALDKKGKKQLEKARKEQAEREQEARENAEQEKKDLEKRERKEREKEEEARRDQEKRDKKEREKEEEARRDQEKRDKKERERPKDQAPQAGSLDKPTRIAVVRIEARTGLDQALADLYADSLVAELRKRKWLKVSSPRDAAAALGADRERKLLGCTEESCMEEVAGALGADRLVSGTVGRVEKSLLINLTLLDARKGVAVATVSERLKSSSNEAFFDALPDLVDKLVGRR